MKYLTKRWLSLVSGLCLFVSCASTESSDIKRLPASSIRQVPEKQRQSVLFVLDNSPSMKPYLPHIRKHASNVLRQLTRAKFFDLTVALITTDMDDPAHSGKFQRYFHSAKLTHKALDKEIDKLFDIPATGSTHEQGLKAVFAALSDKMLEGPHRGFLREGSTLFVVFISDEDDCSMTTAQSKPSSGRDPICQPSQETSLVSMEAYRQKWSALKEKHSLQANTLISSITGLYLAAAGGFKSCETERDCEGQVGAACIKAPKDKRGFCGGCRFNGQTAHFGRRYVTLQDSISVTKVSGETIARPPHGLSSLCHIDKEAYVRNTLSDIAGTILTPGHSDYHVGLQRPVAKDADIMVTITTPSGRRHLVPPAPKTKERCESRCVTPRHGFCYRGFCYGDGYVLTHQNGLSQYPDKAELSGAYVELAEPGSRIEVHYNKAK